MIEEQITAGVWPVRTDAERKDVAIVFIHGYSGNLSATWGEFPRLLKQDARLGGWDMFSLGYTTSLFPNLLYLWSLQPSILTLADLLRTHLQGGLLREYQRIAVLAHSMGGLVIQRALLDDNNIRDRISHLLLFGTPSDGLRKASAFKFWNRQVRDLDADGLFITNLKRDRTTLFTNPPFTFWTVAGDQDDFVPRSASLDPFDRRFHRVVPGNHLGIVKPDSAAHLGVQVSLNAIVAGAATRGPWSAARIAVERGEFQKAIRELEPHADYLDAHAVVQLALALEEEGRSADALMLLERHHATNTDAMGTLAGRLKRRWLHERRHRDGARAREFYELGYKKAAAVQDHPQGFYLAINVAFMALAMDPTSPAALQESRAWAVRALEHASRSPADLWRKATEGEAKLILGDPNVALGCYREAIAMQPTPRQLSSMFQQAYHVADVIYPPGLNGADPMADRLDDLFRPQDSQTAR